MPTASLQSVPDITLYLRLWGKWSILLLPLLSGRPVVPVRIPSIGKIEI